MGYFFKIGSYPKYIPTCKRYISQHAVAVKNELKEMPKFYCSNVSYGWQLGKRLAKKKHSSTIPSLYTKLYCSAAKSRVRNKDILPGALALIGVLTPFPGASIAAFGIGKLLNKVFRISR